jgi:hypothetical protein
MNKYHGVDTCFRVIGFPSADQAYYWQGGAPSRGTKFNSINTRSTSRLHSSSPPTITTTCRTDTGLTITTTRCIDDRSPPMSFDRALYAAAF